MKKALITGITGQDGSYLAELLLGKGYEVHGVVRRSSSLSRTRIDHLYQNPEVYKKTIFLHYCDLEDVTNLRRIIMRVAPDEIYHLAGQSHVRLSFEIPESTCRSSGMGVLELLEIVRDLPAKPRFYHAGSSEVFGSPKETPQRETTPMVPVTPYGCAKTLACHLVRVYRDSYGLFACNGILYNHESPRRGENFVSRKIVKTAVEIRKGLKDRLVLGNMTAKRDWGFAKEYVYAMWLMLQRDEPSDYIIASGVLHSVSDWVNIVFAELGLDASRYIETDEGMSRPADPRDLVGDISKARAELGWSPETDFESLVRLMVRAEMDSRS